MAYYKNARAQLSIDNVGSEHDTLCHMISYHPKITENRIVSIFLLYVIAKWTSKNDYFSIVQPTFSFESSFEVWSILSLYRCVSSKSSSIELHLVSRHFSSVSGIRFLLHMWPDKRWEV